MRVARVPLFLVQLVYFFEHFFERSTLIYANLGWYHFLATLFKGGTIF